MENVMEGVMELSDFLAWLIGPGAGVVMYFIIRDLDFNFTWKGLIYRVTFKRHSARFLRRAGILGPGLLAAAAWAIAAGLGYVDMPVGMQGWAEGLFQVAAAAVTAQLMHGEKEL